VGRRRRKKIKIKEGRRGRLRGGVMHMCIRQWGCKDKRLIKRYIYVGLNIPRGIQIHEHVSVGIPGN